MMRVGAWMADETANHYAELRERRVPAVMAWLMAWHFHWAMVRTVLYDDAMEKVVSEMLAPLESDEESSRTEGREG